MLQESVAVTKAIPLIQTIIISVSVVTGGATKGKSRLPHRSTREKAAATKNSLKNRDNVGEEATSGNGMK